MNQALNKAIWTIPPASPELATRLPCKAGPFAKRSEVDRHERVGGGQVVVDVDEFSDFLKVSSRFTIN
jgi:hypothetical protein